MLKLHNGDADCHSRRIVYMYVFDNTGGFAMTEVGDSLGSPERTIVVTVSFRAGVEPGPYGLGAFNSRGSANDCPAGTPKLLIPHS